MPFSPSMFYQKRVATEDSITFEPEISSGFLTARLGTGETFSSIQTSQLGAGEVAEDTGFFSGFLTSFLGTGGVTATAPIRSRETLTGGGFFPTSPIDDPFTTVESGFPVTTVGIEQDRLAFGGIALLLGIGLIAFFLFRR